MKSAFEQAGLRVFERGWLSCNNVLFAGADECELVDSGYASHAEQTVALVRAGLPAGRGLDRIVNTHLHSDHCGGNHLLQQAFGCRIDVPAGEAAKVDAWDEAALTYRATGQHCPRFERSGALVAGSELQLGAWRWRIHAAPGHDPESIVLHQPDLQILISADALWENGFGVVFPELEGEQAFEDVRATLDQIAALDVRWVIPGHGAPFAAVAPALERAYRRLDGFVADPVRHARHAAKVLVKFHLLEVRWSSHADFVGWSQQTPYLATIHARYFAAESFDAWVAKMLTELHASGALRVDESGVYDLA